MNKILVIAGKEFRSYLTAPMAYIVTCIFLLISGVFFILYLTITKYADTSIQGFVEPLAVFGVSNIGNVFLPLFASVLTMRLLSEEKKIGTWELLLTSPVKDIEVIMGKFLGGLGILFCMIVLTMYFPLMLAIFGRPDMGPIWTSYLGFLLVGSAALAVGTFTSSLTTNQIVAVVVSGGILFALWFVGLAANVLPEGLGNVFSYFSMSAHFANFANGIIDTQDIIYYLSVTALFLYAATRSLETSRWN
ncbi:MAG: ABC transporter permease subunit [Dehalococcoidales bacterium]|nr:ABC transporter permease subunit [Dehalococcoidales bacterium]